MKKVFEIAFVSAAGCLTLAVSQQAVAQVVTETAEGIELRQDTYEEILEYFRRVDLTAPHNTEVRELRLFDNTPILQNNLPGEAVDDSNGPPSQACGWVYNGDGTVSLTDSCETEP